MEFTIRELMERCKLEKPVAYALMTVLVGIGAANIAAVLPPVSALESMGLE